MNTLTQKFDSILQNYIDQEQDYINEHEQIKNILLPLEGKNIDGRTLNKKVLGDFKFINKYGMYYVVGKYEHLIGYSNSRENTIAVNENATHRGFEYLDACHGKAAKERIKKIQLTDKKKALELFSKIEHHFNSLRQLFGQVENEKLGSYDFPVYYDVLGSIFPNEDKNNTSIKLTDFYFIRK